MNNKPRKPIFLLRDQKLLLKFCRRRNKDYNCAEIFGCEIACPLAHANECEYLMNLKNLSLGDAYRSFERQRISEEEGKKIIRERMEEALSNIKLREELWKKAVEAKPYYPQKKEGKR